MKDLVSSWNSESKETIINCFKKAGIRDSSKQLVVTDAYNPLRALTEDLRHLRETDQNVFQEETTVEAFIDLDNNVVAVVPISSDEEMLVKF